MLAIRIWIDTWWTYIKLALLAAGATALFASGWMVKGWKDDAASAVEARIVQSLVNEFHGHEAAVAGILEARLANLRANKTTVERERETIIDRPVYRNVCLDDDGLRLVEAARRGAPAPGKPASAVP